MQKPNTWVCDVCGGSVENVRDGWVEWVEYKEPDGGWKGQDLRLVHHRERCMYNDREIVKRGGSVSDMHLHAFLGPDGLMYLLSKIAAGSIATDEVLDMIKRLHIPGYEQARRHFDRAIYEDVIQQELCPGHFYMQRDINAVLSHNWDDEISGP